MSLDPISRPANGAVFLGGEAVHYDAVSPGSVAVLGIPDAVVVETPDALLVTTRDRAQDVKSLVEVVRERRADLL